MNAGEELCRVCHIVKVLWLSVMAIMVYTWGNQGTLSQILTWLGDASAGLGLKVEFRQTCPLSPCASPAAWTLLLTRVGSLCGGHGSSSVWPQAGWEFCFPPLVLFPSGKVYSTPLASQCPYPPRPPFAMGLFTLLAME